jgi:hypothetical protein
LKTETDGKEEGSVISELIEPIGGNLNGTHHSLLGKSLDLLHGKRCPLLERSTEDALVEVDGVFAGDDIGEGGPPGLCSFRRGHFWIVGSSN